MPRKMTPEMTFETYEDHILFSRAAMKADPDAAGLLPMTDDWMAMLDPVRLAMRRAREADANAKAARVVTNARLDRACTRFGDDLFLAVDKKRSAARWMAFFGNLAVSRFIVMALGRQVARVKGWLTSSQDPVLETHRDELTRWSGAAAEAIDQTNALGILRGEAWQAREQLAEDLTRERDGLHDALSQIARERGLPRDWPDLFFRVDSPASAPSDGGDETPPAPAPTGQ